MSLKPATVVAEHEVFWGEIAPTEHIIHLYSSEAAFLDLLERFVARGLLAYESVIVIATEAHLTALNERLVARRIDLRSAREADRYIDLNAEACLAKFMVAGRPDAHLFRAYVTKLLERAGRNSRRVRAFGEMVALLWQTGHAGATVQLEHLWNDLRKTTPFPLFCSYPKIGFTENTTESLKEICAAHTQVVSNDTREPWQTAD